MIRFLKIFLGQLLKIVLIVLSIGVGLYCAFPVESWFNPQKNPSEMLWWLMLGFSAIGFLSGVIVPFLIEYRQELNIKSFLGEILLGLIALVSIGVGIFLVIALGIAGYASTNSAGNDPHGFAFGIILIGTALVGIIPGILLGALVTTLWKFFLGSKKELR